MIYIFLFDYSLKEKKNILPHYQYTIYLNIDKREKPPHKTVKS